MNLNIRSKLKSIYYFSKQLYILLIEKVMGTTINNFKEIPIIINNFNRLSFLQLQIDALEKRGYNNIYIIDNNSTYPPLLDYYNKTPYKVFRLNENVGFLSLWKTGIYKKFKNQYFVYTDSDVVPIDECPNDVLEHFWRLMQRYPRASKIGFSLKIDDLPDSFVNKAQVVTWEQQFWQKSLSQDLFLASIDTTFALYRPNVKGGANFGEFMIRTGGKYTARHMPWYNDDNNLSEEERFYINSSQTSTYWTKKSH